MALKKQKTRIAFVCIYSAGGCGVWASTKKLAEELTKRNYDVAVFSTNKIKGSKKTADSFECENNLNIHRFRPYFSFGRNINFWNFRKKLKEFNPDIIVAQVYRHPHTLSVLNFAKKLKKPAFLITHAPFVDENQRGKLGKIIEFFYDKNLGKKHLNSFDEIFAITKWELPFLKKIGFQNKTHYLPNGIYEDFFKLKTSFRKPKNILFLGRVSPVKNLDVLINALGILKKQNKDFRLKILGPPEETYALKLKNLSKNLNLNDCIEFEFNQYDLKKELQELKNSDICVLPSSREAMPQTLIEAMASEKIVIASDTQGAKEIISDKKDGFLFSIGDEKDLAEKIKFVLGAKQENIKKIQINARISAEKYKLKNITDKFEKVIKQHLK